jgi:hypothetical protein
MQPAPAVTHAPSTHASPASQHTSASPQRTALAHASAHDPATHSLPAGQQTSGSPHSSAQSSSAPVDDPLDGASVVSGSLAVGETSVVVAIDDVIPPVSTPPVGVPPVALELVSSTSLSRTPNTGLGTHAQPRTATETTRDQAMRHRSDHHPGCRRRTSRPRPGSQLPDHSRPRAARTHPTPAIRRACPGVTSP